MVEMNEIPDLTIKRLQLEKDIDIYLNKIRNNKKSITDIQNKIDEIALKIANSFQNNRSFKMYDKVLKR